MRCGPPHMNDEGPDENGSNDAEDALPQRLIDAHQQPTESEAGAHGCCDSPVHRGLQPVAACLAQVREDDRDGEEGLEAFAENDDERWEHGDYLRSCKAPAPIIFTRSGASGCSPFLRQESQTPRICRL